MGSHSGDTRPGGSHSEAIAEAIRKPLGSHLEAILGGWGRWARTPDFFKFCSGFELRGLGAQVFCGGFELGSKSF